MAFALVANATAQAASNATTGAIDTTGANLLIAVVGWYSAVGEPTLTDSKSNSWTMLTKKTSNNMSVLIYYAIGATVGSGHTFTASGTGKYATICVGAFSGGHASSPYEAESAGATSGSATSLQPGTLTPAENDELVITGLGLDGSTSAESINGGFTITDLMRFAPGVAEGAGMAYLIQTSAAAANPTWSWTSGVPCGAVQACFRAASVAAPPRSSNLLLMGVS